MSTSGTIAGIPVEAFEKLAQSLWDLPLDAPAKSDKLPLLKRWGPISHTWGDDSFRIIVEYLEWVKTHDYAEGFAGKFDDLRADINKFYDRVEARDFDGDECWVQRQLIEDEAKQLADHVLVVGNRLIREAAVNELDGPLDKRTVEVGYPSKHPKRGNRLANIEKLKRELKKCHQEAKNQAYQLERDGKEPGLLPRPTKKELGKRVDINDYDVTRCFKDDGSLQILYDRLNDLDAVMERGQLRNRCPSPKCESLHSFCCTEPDCSNRHDRFCKECHYEKVHDRIVNDEVILAKDDRSADEPWD